MARESLNWLLALFVLLIVSILALRASAAQEPRPTLQPGPIVRMLRAGEQTGQPARNGLRRLNDARPGWLIPKLPVRPQ